MRDSISILGPITKSADDLLHEIPAILRSLDAVEGQRGSAEDVQVAVTADTAFVLDDILCTYGEHFRPGKKPSLKEFCAVITTARMLQNGREADVLGIDATFNVLHTDLALGIVCRLSSKDTARPVAVAVIHRESTTSMHHLLTNVRHLSERLGFGDAGPTEVVIDGSAALYQAATKAYPGLRVHSCYFHAIKNAREVKGKSKLPTHLWNKLRQDLQVLANSFSREEWTRLRDHLITKWKDGILPTLNFAADRRALKTFFDDWEEYLNPNKWRSYWGSYTGEFSGPRTNNAVERFNREMKERIIPQRRKLTLSEFAAMLQKPGAWTTISQYGKSAVRGAPSRELRAKAAVLYVNNSFCQIPRSWRFPGHDDESIRGMVRWLFVDRTKETVPADLRDLINSSDNAAIKGFCCIQYDSLDAAAKMKKSYSIVSYTRSADLDLSPPAGPWCTCHGWTANLVCQHVICIAYSMGLETSAEAIRDWAAVTTSFRPPHQKRDARGLIQEPSVPSTVRYGLRTTTNPKRGEGIEEEHSVEAAEASCSENSPAEQAPDRTWDLGRDRMTERSSPGEDDGQATRFAYEDVTWPSHPPAEDDALYCGCGRGYSAYVTMIKCSNSQCLHKWWHIDCAAHYATAAGITSGHEAALGNRKRWYCFSCRGATSTSRCKA